MCTVKVPLSFQTIYSYISHYFQNKQVTDELDKTEDGAAAQEEEGIPCVSDCYEKLAVCCEE